MAVAAWQHRSTADGVVASGHSSDQEAVWKSRRWRLRCEPLLRRLRWTVVLLRDDATGRITRGVLAHDMTLVGDRTDGFEVSLDPSAQAVCVKAWGFWSAELASKLLPSVVSACQARLGPVSLVMDARGLKPQREPGQEALGSLMATLPGLGVVRGSVTTDSSLTRLQLLRIAKERAAKTPVQFTLVDT